MNIYQKIAEARVQFQSRCVKMSGSNKFAGYNYFELSDILPVINVIAKELGFLCEVSFNADGAMMIVRDTEKPGDVATFTSPMSTASLKGCHEVQNLGAVETYIKRYLYQNAFEIVENDGLNMTHGKPEKQDDASEYVPLKTALIDYIHAGAFEHPGNVEAVIAKKDIANMKKALAAAKTKEQSK
jgi:hypothetical protein